MNQGYYNGGNYNNGQGYNPNPYYNNQNPNMYNNRNMPNGYYGQNPMNNRNPNMNNQNMNNPNMNKNPNKKDDKNKKSLLPLFIVLGALGLVAVILLIVFLVSSSGNNDKKEDKPQEPAVLQDKVVGNDTNGYITVPGDWVNYVDSQNADNAMIQFSSKDKKYIVTLVYYTETNINPYSGAAAIAKSLKDEGCTDLKAAKITLTDANYETYIVSGVYPDKTVMVTYFFEAEDGVTHCIMVEGPDATNNAFNIPATWKLKK